MQASSVVDLQRAATENFGYADGGSKAVGSQPCFLAYIEWHYQEESKIPFSMGLLPDGMQDLAPPSRLPPNLFPWPSPFSSLV